MNHFDNKDDEFEIRDEELDMKDTEINEDDYEDDEEGGEKAELEKKSPEDKKKNAADGKESEYEDVCFICRRPESKAGKMFKLPNNISVCNDCMHKTMDTVSQFDYQTMHGTTNSTVGL